MTEHRDELQEQIQGLNTALASVLDQLGTIESEVTAVKSEAANQITAIREFLNSPKIAALAGPDPEPGADLKWSTDAISKLSGGESQDQILEIYLEEVEALTDRGILFLQADSYQVSKSFGFEESVLESISVRENDPIQRAADQQRIIYKTDGLEENFPWLADAGEPPAASVCVPLVFGDSVPVVLYADSSKAIEIDSLELLSSLAVLVLKNHYLAVQLGVESEEVAAEPTPPPPTEAPEPESESEAEAVEDIAPEAEEPETPLQSSDWAQFFEPVSEPEEDLEEEEETRQPELLEDVELVEEEDESADFETFEEDEAPSLESLLTGDESETITEEDEADLEAGEEVPPPVVEPPEETAPAEEDLEPARDEETERKHQEAKRFARLLVSEIKLYHEEEVNEGRKNADLYDRLRKDIDRSREMYERRVSQQVRASEDYFHQQLVGILAEGDPDVLGEGYPGAKTSSPE